MLETAVHPIEMLRAVKIQADQMKVATGSTLSYHEVCKLLISAATEYDSGFLNRASKPVASARRAVYSHDINTDVYDNGAVDHDYDINIAIDTIQANVNKVNPNHSNTTRIAFPQWKQLSKEAQSTWETLSDSDKSIILQSLKTVNHPRTKPTGTPRQDVYLNESLYNTDDTADIDVLIDSTADDDNSTALLAYVTKQKPFGTPSSDIRRVLSTNKMTPMVLMVTNLFPLRSMSMVKFIASLTLLELCTV
jgi:hypothetical protein